MGIGSVTPEVISMRSCAYATVARESASVLKIFTVAYMSFKAQSIGLKRISRFRSNSAGSGGGGNGDARYTADSIDSRTA